MTCALWLGWKHDDLISRVASFSGSFWMESPCIWEQIANGRKANLKRIYLDSGDSDGEGHRSYQADNLCYGDRTHSALASKGFSTQSPVQDVPFNHPIEELSFLYWSENMQPPESELCFLVGEGQAHNEAAWKERLGVALRFLFSSFPEEEKA